MYERFFGFTERPFELTPNPRFLVGTSSHGEALANLEYGIASRKGITLLVGDAGTGKTTLVRTVIERQKSRVHCVYLHNPALTRSEFLEMLAVHFDLSTEARASKAACLLELEALLRRRHQTDPDATTVLVVDEAQSLSFELLEEIRLLANIETAETKLLSLILAGQPELAVRLNDDSLRQLKQRIALRCTLHPLTVQETAAYLAGRIRAAGGRAAHVLTQDAVMAIHEHARGIPRAINVLADNALVTAFALQQRPVTRRMVLDVCRDFDLRTDDLRTDDLRTNRVPDQGTAATIAGDTAPLAAAADRVVPPDAGRLLRIDHSTVSAADQLHTAITTPQPSVPEPDVRTAVADQAPKRRRFSLF